MNLYPKNRIYAIIPKFGAEAPIGSVIEKARKNLNKESIIWDFPINSPKLELLKKIPAIKLMNHDEALELMATEKWNQPNEESKDLQSLKL